MTDTKKTAADQYLYIFELKRQNILSAEEFEKQRKAILNRPVFKEDDFLSELAQWAEIKGKGGVTPEEFEARKKILLADNKRSVNEPLPVAAPVQSAAPAKKKKKWRCGCFTTVFLAAGTLGLLSLIPSCGNKEKAQENTSNYGLQTTIRSQVQTPSRPAQVEQALTQSEPWRAEFTQKMQAAGLDEATQQLLHDGMSKISAGSAWVTQHNLSTQYRNNREFSKVDRCEQYKTDLLAFLESLDRKVTPEQQGVWNNAINLVYRRVVNRLKRGAITTYDPIKIGEEMIARVQAERTRQQVQSRTVGAGR